MRWLFRIFTVAYVVALGLFLAGIFGWIAEEPNGPLADTILQWLGLPWNLLLDGDDAFGLLGVLLAPAVNLGILWLVADLVESRES